MKNQSIASELTIQKTIISILDQPERSDVSNEQQKSAYTTILRTILPTHADH